MTWCIILLAGKNTRFSKIHGKKINELINKKPMFMHVLDTCKKCNFLDKIIIVINKKHKNAFTTSKLYDVVIGSEKNRQESIDICLNKIKKNIKKDDVVVTLDGDRPFVSASLIKKVVNVAKKYNAASAIIPVHDSIIKIKNTCNYIDRKSLFAVQTPQVFKFKMWKKTKSNQGTDFFSPIGFNLKKENFVIGELENFKITTKTDLKFAKKLII